MDLIRDLALQGLQMVLVLALAPLLLGFTRKVKARMLRRRGPPVLQPYRDLLRLIRKEAVIAENASWLFRAGPYMIFAATWVAAALVPTFATGLVFSWTADLIAITALLGSARFFLALVGMDIGTSFGGIGSSREMMFASLAEPAMIMIAFTLALLAGSTQLSAIAQLMLTHGSLRVSLGLALAALIIVAIAENARIPVDNPATHLELTMVHEAMVLEYSGRHLAMIELAAAVKLLLYISLIACIFCPWGLAPPDSDLSGLCRRRRDLCGQAVRRRLPARAVRDLDRQDAGVPGAGLPGDRAHARPARHAAALHVAELLMPALFLDLAHVLAGGLVLVSFMLLYQDRMFGLLNVFALHAVILSASVAWQGYIQAAPHLFITALIALGLKAIIIPVALQAHGRCGSASTAPSRPWSASARPCWPAWGWWRCRWWSCSRPRPGPIRWRARTWRSPSRWCCSGC